MPARTNPSRTTRGQLHRHEGNKAKLHAGEHEAGDGQAPQPAVLASSRHGLQQRAAPQAPAGVAVNVPAPARELHEQQQHRDRDQFGQHRRAPACRDHDRRHDQRTQHAAHRHADLAERHHQIEHRRAGLRHQQMRAGRRNRAIREAKHDGPKRQRAEAAAGRRAQHSQHGQQHDLANPHRAVAVHETW